MFADMKRVKKFVPTLRKVLEVYGIDKTLELVQDMIDNGGYSTVSELQQGLESDLENLENEVDNSDEEMDCLGCDLGKERACADCCRDWDNEEDD